MAAEDNVSKGVFFALATAIVASTAGAATKFIAGEVAIPVIVFVQYALCLLIMMPWLFRRGLSPLKTARPGEHLLRGVMGWLCFFTYYLALEQIPLVDASLLRNTAPLIVPLVVFGWMKVIVPKRRWWPMLVGFAGVILIIKPEISDMKIWHLVGLLSGISLAVSMVATRSLASTESSSVILFYYFLISLLCSIPLAIVHWQSIPFWTLPYLIYIGLSICLTMWLYTQAYSCTRASVIAPVNYSGVVFAGLLGWIIWNHIPDIWAILGIVFVIGAGLLSVYLNIEEKLSTE